MRIYDAAFVIICVCERVGGGLGLGETKKVVWKGKKRVTRGYNTVRMGGQGHTTKKRKKERKKERKTQSKKEQPNVRTKERMKERKIERYKEMKTEQNGKKTWKKEERKL